MNSLRNILENSRKYKQEELKQSDKFSGDLRPTDDFMQFVEKTSAVVEKSDVYQYSALDKFVEAFKLLNLKIDELEKCLESADGQKETSNEESPEETIRLICECYAYFGFLEATSRNLKNKTELTGMGVLEVSEYIKEMKRAIDQKYNTLGE